VTVIAKKYSKSSTPIKRQPERRPSLNWKRQGHSDWHTPSSKSYMGKFTSQAHIIKLPMSLS
jgi:hypothetical protein